MAIDFNVAEDIPEAYDLFINLPVEAHLLCPKVSEEDDEDYEDTAEPGDIGVEEKARRIQDFKRRVGIVYQTSLIFGFEEENAALQLQEFRTRTNGFLTVCSQCVRTWHRNRKPFLKHLSEIHDEGTVAEMGRRLDRFDAARITIGLEGAKSFIDSHDGIVEQKTFIEEDRSDLLVALYESLCCIAYLRQPENRVHFNYVFTAVQQRRPLKLAEVLPTMTRFLFDEDKTRLAFARISWTKMAVVSANDFDWAVKESLEDAMQKLNVMGVSPSQVQRFWEGLALILNALPSDEFVAALGSLSVQPSIYQLMLNHMSVDSESTLAVILKVFNMILQRGPKGIWGAFGTFSPVSVAEPVFASPAFRRLLAQTREYSISMPEDKYLKGPVAVAWVKPFIESIRPAQRSDACDSFSQHLFDDISQDDSLPFEGKLACYRGLGEALTATLESFLEPAYNLTSGQPSIFTNRTINLTLKHKDVIVRMVKLDRQNLSVSRIGQSVIAAVLKLDCSVTAAEFTGYTSNNTVQREVVKKSPELWEAFLELLVPGATELAKTMLMAILPLVPVERLRSKKKEYLSQAQEEFNATLGKVAASIGKIFDKLEAFSLTDLNHLLESEMMKPVVAALIHGENDINQGGLNLIKSVTNESSRGDAISELTKTHFSTLLTSMTEVLHDQVPIMTENQLQVRLWSPQQHILRCSKDLLDALCNPRDGLLRSRDLSNAERFTLKKWWSRQWTAIERAFNGLEVWSRSIETEVMKQFCRDTMELAEKFLEQDGLMASALGSKSIRETMLDSSDDDSKIAMQEILKSPCEKCMGLTSMLRLRDQWLIQITVNVVCKLLRRLIEYDVQVPKNVTDFIQRACVKNALGKFEVATNLNNQQRAELLRTLGEDDDDIQIIEVKKIDVPKKQSKLDQWSKAGDTISQSQPLAIKTNKEDIRDLTSTIDKNRGILDQFRARQNSKPIAKPAAAKPATLRLDAASIKEARLKEKEAKKKRDAEVVARAKALRAPRPLVPGEGSGLQGLAGVQGKDHAPRSEMMVDSSSDEGDDSEDDAAFRAQTQAGKQRAEDASRRIMQLKPQRGPVKKMKIQRSAKDMRARLTPPMDVLHQALLEWDIFHEGNDPPNGVKCARVSTSYGDPHQYKNTFLPLLVYEAWRSFVTDKNETTSKPFGIKVATRMNVDNFIDVTTTMPFKPNSKDEFLSEGDIVLLSVSPQPLQGREEAHCLSRISRVQIKQGAREVSYRISARAGPIIQLLSPKAEIYAVKITNMRTIEREFASLESLQYYDLMQEILEAKPSPMLTFGTEAVDKVMANYHLNHGQAKAILNARANDAFTLIQGPPGTGKTKTIVAMVGALLTGNLGTTTGTVIHKPGQSGAGQTMSKKLLVCAPSNAAVDELVLRLKQGVKTMNGSFHKINVLRLGRSDAINTAVKDVTLDELVRLRIEGDATKESGPNNRQKMHEEAGQIKQELSEVRPMLDAARAANDREQINILERKFDELKRRQVTIGNRIDADKDSGNTAQRESEIRRRQAQQEILDSAHVLCSTLSGAGHETLKNLQNVEFETVIIDEAAQCVELSALIPLKYGCSKCILVGDPKQLPPTVLSQSAQRYGYDQSLFVRMQQNSPNDVHLLDKQYRMHPEISQFPSQEFYEGKLADGADMARLRHQPWHQSGLLGPYRFFDVLGNQGRGRKGQSLVNFEELKVAMQLYERFRMDNPKVDLKGKIGIITPYKAQLFELRDRFTSRYGPGITEEIEFNTTDAFQGRECEIIIFSCVRASPTGGIGFMTDIRRMNVGLTRAKSSLWILGDSRALVQGEYWNKLITDAKARDRYTSGNILAQLSTPGAKLPPPVFSNVESPQTPVSEPEPMEIEPVEIDERDMKDVLVRPTSAHNRRTSQLPETYTVLERSGPLGSNVPPSYSGINERGEPINGGFVPPARPVIHSSGGQKRPADGPADGAQPTKRKPSGFLPGKSVPTRPRAMPIPPRPTDPSAMSVMSSSKPNGDQGSISQPPPNAPKGPRPRPNPMASAKKKVDPFIQKKPKPPR